MRREAAALLLAVGAGLASPARADSSAGAESFDFLLFDGNARAVAMGGAYTALATDSGAMLYNPAGLGLVKRPEVSMMHNQYVQGLTQDTVMFSHTSGFGAQLNYVDLGGIDRTTLSQPGGTGSSFGVNDFSGGAGYGHAFGDSFSVGVAGKLVRESIDNVVAQGAAGDLGVMYRPAALKQLTLAASALNLGPAIKFQSLAQKLPTTGRAGAAYSFSLGGNPTVLAVDGSKVLTDKVRMGVGAETILLERMAVRVGFTTRNETDIGITAGVGWSWRDLAVDYAFVPMGSLGLANEIGLTFRWGGARQEQPQAKTNEEVFQAAQRLIEEGRYDEAKAELESVSRRIEDQTALHVLYYERLGTIARLERDWATAKARYVDALKLANELKLHDQTVADAYAGAGMYFVAKGQEQVGVKFFQKALELGPSSANAGIARAELDRLTLHDAPR